MLSAERGSLGKGEVDSSILSGSTSKAHISRLSDDAPDGISAVSGRTKRKHDNSTRGKSVDFVRGLFRTFIGA